MKNASVSVRKWLTTYPSGNIPMFRIAFTSLSELPGRRLEAISRSATNCKAGGIISFFPCKAIFKPRSSIKAAISMSDCSSDVSFKSAGVDNSFLRLPPPTVGWAVEHSSTPSPKVTEDALLHLRK